MSRVAEFMRFPIKTVFMANNLPFLTGGSAAQTTDSGPSAPTSQGMSLYLSCLCYFRDRVKMLRAANIDIELATPNRNHYRNSIVTRTLRLRLAFHPGLLHRRGSADCPIMRLSPELILMLMGYLNAYNAEDGFSLGLTCTRFYAIRHEHFGVLDTYCFDRNQFGNLLRLYCLLLSGADH